MLQGSLFTTFNLLRDAPLTRFVMRLLSSGLQYSSYALVSANQVLGRLMAGTNGFPMCNLTQECCDTLHLQEA
jgi:hypothetical protein